jgi:hypothetical protein
MQLLIQLTDTPLTTNGAIFVLLYAYYYMTAIYSGRLLSLLSLSRILINDKECKNENEHGYSK